MWGLHPFVLLAWGEYKSSNFLGAALLAIDLQLVAKEACIQNSRALLGGKDTIEEVTLISFFFFLQLV